MILSDYCYKCECDWWRGHCIWCRVKIFLYPLYEKYKKSTAKFSKNELFCIKCLISDGFFRDGGSWIPDRCPKCGGTECINYGGLTIFQKLEVRKTGGRNNAG